MVSGISKIAVVHLVRCANGISPFKDFLDSYKQFAVGVDHQLVIIFKGFGAGPGADYLSELNGLDFIQYDHPDDGGYDIGPYFEVGHTLDFEYFCFLNSFSIIRCDDWLGKLMRIIISEEKIGLVGATGTWERNSGDPEFPNWHIRSNGFVISKKMLLNIECPDITTKQDASDMESGKNSITRQIIKMGYETRVVDSNGKCWPPEDWPHSQTFRNGNHEGLLISDNRTRAFDAADAWEKDYLSDLAWKNKRNIPNPYKRDRLRVQIRRWMQLFFRRLTQKD